MEKKIDLETWARREAYELFSRTAWPFYSVVFPVDVTAVRAAAKRDGQSFYYTMIWVCNKAINRIPAFRQRIRGDMVVELERTDPSFTDLKKGAEQFHIVTMPWEEDRKAFCAHAAANSAAQTAFIDESTQNDALVYYSCLPWFDLTALTNEHSDDRDDTIPRLAWGKYEEREGRLLLHLSVEVNHRLIDGLHLGRFYEALQEEIRRLET